MPAIGNKRFSFNLFGIWHLDLDQKLVMIIVFADVGICVWDEGNPMRFSFSLILDPLVNVIRNDDNENISQEKKKGFNLSLVPLITFVYEFEWCVELCDKGFQMASMS